MSKVLCVTIQYPPHHLGGYEVSCRDVMVRLAGRGHDVTVLTSDLRLPDVHDPTAERTSGVDGVTVRRDLTLYMRDGQLWNPLPTTRWRVEKRNQAALASALEATTPDVVSIWHIGAVSIGLLTTLIASRIPLVYGISDDWLSYEPVLDAWSRMFRTRPRLARLVEAVSGVPTRLPDVGGSGTFCFISEVTRRRAEELSPWTFPDSTVVYSGVDRTIFNAGEAGLGPTRQWQGRLLYVGRYDQRKGIETLLEALPLLPAVRLEVQGKGDERYRSALEQRAGALRVDDRVIFAAAERAELAERYRASDAVVFPSEWEEPFGLVPVEAMAVGTPVVATGSGGSGEFLFDGVNCVRFRAGSTDDLARAVRRLEANPELRATLVRAGLATAGYFDVEHLSDAFEAWHEAAISGFVNGRPADRLIDPSVLSGPQA